MNDERRIIQPVVIMPPPPPVDDVPDEEASRFIEDTSVPTDLTFSEWVAQNRPQAPAEPEVLAGVPAADIPDD